MAKKKNATLADSDDDALFRDAMQDVAPLPVSDKAIFRQQKPVPKPQQSNRLFDDSADTDAVFLDLEADGEWVFLRPGVSRQTLRRLKNRYWGIQDNLDLHGLTQESAREQLGLFLEHAIENHYRCVKVIHGKGLSSAERIPVLKRSIGGWLAQCGAVLAFSQARVEDGGGGAVLVLLKK